MDLAESGGSAAWRGFNAGRWRSAKLYDLGGLACQGRTCSSDMYSDMLKLSAFGGLARQKCEHEWHLYLHLC